MKKLTIIGLTIALLIVVALLFWPHTKHQSIQPNMETRVYKIAPDIFFTHLSSQLSPKDGETHSQLLARFLEGQHIDIQKPPDSLFVNDEKGLLFVKASSQEQAAVEHFVVQFNNAR